MHHVDVHSRLSTILRQQVNELIHLGWSYEALEGQDVEMLVDRGEGVSDPLDEISQHVLAWDSEGRLVGYGRVAVTSQPEALTTSTGELHIPNVKIPVGYISRLVVHPEHRARGIGSLIHKTRIEIARKLGAREVYGWAVGEKPRSALSHLGFKEITEKHGFSAGWYRTDRLTRLVKYDLGDTGAAPKDKAAGAE